MTPPRYWDGRVRAVVSRRSLRAPHGQKVRVETLECGHAKIPTFTAKGAGSAHHQYRVCNECPGVER